MTSRSAHHPRTAARSLPRRALTGPSREPLRSPRLSSNVRPSPATPATDPTGATPSAAASRPRSVRRELVLIAVLYLAYAASRMASVAPAGAEIHNGHRVMEFERMLHIAPERTLNNWLYDAPSWLPVVAAYFYETMHYALTAATLIWLWRVSPAAYRRARNWLAAMTFPALIAFWSFPVAPPRTLPGGVAHDIVAEQHSYGWWGSGGGTAPRGFAGLVNENAAMPSLHVGWALWVGWNIAHSARHPVVRAFGCLYPPITTAVVVSTGNHYLLDVVAGALLTLLAQRFVVRVAPRLSSLGPRRAGVGSDVADVTIRVEERRPPARTHAAADRRPICKSRSATAVRHRRIPR